MLLKVERVEVSAGGDLCRRKARACDARRKDKDLMLSVAKETRGITRTKIFMRRIGKGVKCAFPSGGKSTACPDANSELLIVSLDGFRVNARAVMPGVRCATCQME